MKILITGASGFVGRYLAAELADHGHDVILTAPVAYRQTLKGREVAAHVCHLSDLTALRRLIATAGPEAVIHLAALPNVQESWGDRSALVTTNVTGTIHLCEALVGQSQPVHLLYVSSGMVYRPVRGAEACDETTPVFATNPYGASKLAAENVVRSFAGDRLKVTIARPFNHIGPGQAPSFACSAFAQRVAATPDGGVIPVGNLASYRDFTDVRDVVRAYRLMIERRPAPDLFVLGSGKAVSLKEILEHFIRLSGKKLSTQIDPQLLRPADPERMVANPALAKKELGWEPRISLKTTLNDIYSSVRSSLP